MLSSLGCILESEAIERWVWSTERSKNNYSHICFPFNQMRKVDLNGDGQLSPEEISKFTTETGSHSFIII